MSARWKLEGIDRRDGKASGERIMRVLQRLFYVRRFLSALKNETTPIHHQEDHSMTQRNLLVSGIILFLILLLLVPAATAQTRRYPTNSDQSKPERESRGEKEFATQGVVELGGTAGFSSYTSVSNGQSSSTTYTTVSLAPSIGYFVADGLEIGLYPVDLEIDSHTGATNAVTQFTIMGALAYTARTSGTVYPVIEGEAGYSTVSSGGASASGFSWGVRGGIKVELAPHALLGIGVHYLQITTNPDGATARYGYNLLEIGIGFSVWL
jgi:hypothetical protein